MKKGRKAHKFLDVTEYLLTGPFSPKPSPHPQPAEIDQSDVLSFTVLGVNNSLEDLFSRYNN